ncbi:hypothetical protein ACIPSE_12820 [Streptomyces sp. NPDC090106]|uniref:hypothetical protein n=1 Tax=Streptomyces sp. NPDC090106 TaxID=3365946 RepID=UPI0037F1F6CB
MCEFIPVNTERLTLFQLPTCAPDPNPTDGVCSLFKRDIGNLTTADLVQITRAVKSEPKILPYRPEAIDGCLAATDPEPTWTWTGERRVGVPEMRVVEA